MRILAKLLFFNQRFSTDFITTIGTTIYVPNLEWLDNDPDIVFSTLSHEYIHMLDRKTYGRFAFSLSYLSPQVFFLLGFVHPLSFLCLLPFPSPMRTHWELRGYSMTLASSMLLTPGLEPSIDWIIEQFTSSNYYWMFPYSNYIRIFLESEIARIKSGNLNPTEQKIKKLLDELSNVSLPK